MTSARIEGNKLVVTIDLQEPTRSASGKTLVIASTHGNLTLTVEGYKVPVTIGLNAYIKS